MFSYNGADYDLHFNLERLKLIEAKTGESAVASVVKNGGNFGIAELETYYGFGLIEVDEGGKLADAYATFKKGVEVCDGILETESYQRVNELLAEALVRDLPFLFRTA